MDSPRSHARQQCCSLPQQYRSCKRKRFLWSFLIISSTVLFRHRADAAASLRQQHHWRLRGGADPEPINDEDKEIPAKLWTPGALFRLNDEIKSEIIPDDEVVSKESESAASKEPHKSGRGGALTMVKPKRFQWLAPLDTSRVAPSSSRLLKDDGETIEQQLVIEKEPTRRIIDVRNDVGKLWWNNAWNEQLPDEEMEELSDHIEEDISENITMSENVIQIESKKPKAESDKKEEALEKREQLEALEETASVERDLVLAPDETADEIMEEADDEMLAPSQEMKESTTLVTLPTNVSAEVDVVTAEGSEEESPFVSSGYVSDNDGFR